MKRRHLIASMPLAAMLIAWARARTGQAVGSTAEWASAPSPVPPDAGWWLEHTPRQPIFGGMVGADGRRLPTGLFAGRWSVVFFGFASCSQVCPTTLRRLADWQAASAGAGRNVQLVFATVDPLNDTPERLSQHLATLGARIVAMTGTPTQSQRLQDSVGVGAEPVAGGIDHPTSLFVVAPSGIVAGALLRPLSASHLDRDLAALQSAHAASRHLRA